MRFVLPVNTFWRKRQSILANVFPASNIMWVYFPPVPERVVSHCWKRPLWSPRATRTPLLSFLLLLVVVKRPAEVRLRNLGLKKGDVPPSPPPAAADRARVDESLSTYSKPSLCAQTPPSGTSSAGAWDSAVPLDPATATTIILVFRASHTKKTEAALPQRSSAETARPGPGGQAGQTRKETEAALPQGSSAEPAGQGQDLTQPNCQKLFQIVRNWNRWDH